MRYTTTDGPSKALNAIQDGSLGDKMGNAGELPGFEPIMVVKDLDEPLGQHLRELQPSVV